MYTKWQPSQQMMFGILVAFIAIAPRVSSADYTAPTYEGWQCNPATGDIGTSSDDYWIAYNASGYATNADSVPHTVVCPIDKYTSNWGISNDNIKSINITVSGSGSSPVSCTVDVWSAAASFSGTGGPTNVEEDPSLAPVFSPANPSHATMPLALSNVLLPNDYFDAFWNYADMTCVLNAGASLESYQVKEAGTNQMGAAIYPATGACLPYNMDYGYRGHQGSDDYWSISGGQLADGDKMATNDAWDFFCFVPVPSGYWTDAAISYLTGNQGDYDVGCAPDSNFTYSIYVSTQTSGTNFPADDMWWSRAVTSGYECNHVSNVAPPDNWLLGDARLMSFIVSD